MKTNLIITFTLLLSQFLVGFSARAAGPLSADEIRSLAKALVGSTSYQEEFASTFAGMGIAHNLLKTGRCDLHDVRVEQQSLDTALLHAQANNSQKFSVDLQNYLRERLLAPQKQTLSDYVVKTEVARIEEKEKKFKEKTSNVPGVKGVSIKRNPTFSDSFPRVPSADDMNEIEKMVNEMGLKADSKIVVSEFYRPAQANYYSYDFTVIIKDAADGDKIKTHYFHGDRTKSARDARKDLANLIGATIGHHELLQDVQKFQKEVDAFGNTLKIFGQHLKDGQTAEQKGLYAAVKTAYQRLRPGKKIYEAETHARFIAYLDAKEFLIQQQLRFTQTRKSSGLSEVAIPKPSRTSNRYPVQRGTNQTVDYYYDDGYGDYSLWLAGSVYNPYANFYRPYFYGGSAVGPGFLIGLDNMYYSAGYRSGVFYDVYDPFLMTGAVYDPYGYGYNYDVGINLGFGQTAVIETDIFGDTVIEYGNRYGNVVVVDDSWNQAYNPAYIEEDVIVPGIFGEPEIVREEVYVNNFDAPVVVTENPYVYDTPFEEQQYREEPVVQSADPFSFNQQQAQYPSNVQDEQDDDQNNQDTGGNFFNDNTPDSGGYTSDDDDDFN